MYIPQVRAYACSVEINVQADDNSEWCVSQMWRNDCLFCSPPFSYLLPESTPMPPFLCVVWSDMPSGMGVLFCLLVVNNWCVFWFWLSASLFFIANIIFMPTRYYSVLFFLCVGSVSVVEILLSVFFFAVGFFLLPLSSWHSFTLRLCCFSLVPLKLVRRHLICPSK